MVDLNAVAGSLTVVPLNPTPSPDLQARVHEGAPQGLRTYVTAAEGRPQPVVVLVHGSLDRGTSFARTVSRLETGTVAYDRRGYQGSRDLGAAPDLDSHVDDLMCLARSAGSPVVCVGHSFGGVIVQAAALRAPELFAAIGAFEPPMPWLGFARDTMARTIDPGSLDPEVEVERFFVRMMGQASWDRLSDGVKDDRRADGPALVSDLTIIWTASFDPTKLSIPVRYGCGGAASAEHHRKAAAWLSTSVPGAELTVIDSAGHGAHLSHPDAFAAFVNATIEQGN